MSATHNRRARTLLAWHLLAAVSVFTIMGCQAAAYRRNAQRVSRPQPRAAHDASQSGPTPSASDRSEDQIAASQAAAPEVRPVVLADTDAAEMFRRLRGKLRTNDNGTVVEVDLSYSDVTDEALASIEIFQEIRGMTSLSKIPSLVLLDASNTAVTDDGLAHASQWTSLRYLSLNNTAVTDASIPYLTSIKTLKGLSLLHSNVTADGSRTLKEALPDCLIVTEAENQLSPPAAAVPLRPVPSQSGVAFPTFPATADTQLEQLVELAGKQPQLAVLLATVYSSREQWPQAVRILGTAAAVDPQLQTVQLALGVALARSGDSPAAKTHLTQAVGKAAAHYNLGMIEYEDNLRSCAAHMRQAVAADPSLTDAQTRLQEVQQELATLNQQRTPVHAVSSGTAISTDAPFEVIPAPAVRTATFSNNDQLRPILFMK